MGHRLGLIVKGTRGCNLRCTYCHDWRTGPGHTMTFPVLARMTAAALQDGAYESVTFMWHGGEPLVLPRAWYEKALYVQARLRRPGQRIVNAVQTNGTLLDAAWARFFRAHDVRVSVSLDGPLELHDRTRVYASGRPTFGDVARGLDVLRAHGVPFSALMVIDDEALALGADRIFDTFLSLGVTRFGLIAATPTNQPDATPGTPAAHYVEPSRMVPFLTRMYERWREHGDPGIQIREIEAIRRRVRGQEAGTCTLAGGCLGHYYAVEPNGDVAHCDMFVGDPRYTLGNITGQTFAEIGEQVSMRALRDENDAALRSMQACPDFGVCNGGCPHDRYLGVRHDPGHRADCCGLRVLIEHVRTREAGDAAGARPAPAHPCAG